MVVFIGLAFVGFGVYNIWHSLRLQRKGIFTVGTVAHIKGKGSVPNMFVKFKTLRKKTIVFRADGWASTSTVIVWTFVRSSPLYEIGSSVPVLYDPHNPTDAVIQTFDFMWVQPIITTGFGLFFLYIGFTH